MFIVKRDKGRGQPCYYLVKNSRVNGQPRVVWQKYLGTAETVLKRIEGKSEITVHSKSFGSVTSFLSLAHELNLQGIISDIIPDNNLKLKVYQHFLMQAIHQFNEPNSKKASVGWYKDSILPLIWHEEFSSPQTIMNQFDKLVSATKNKIPEIEEKICGQLLKNGIKPSILIWDPTNFYTYITKGGDLPRKGNSKEKRYDKNIVNLGLVVSDENIPLMHTLYEGNKRETKVITGIVDTIFRRMKSLGINTEKLVFVFDKGNNSKTNIQHINDKLSFIGSLRRDQLKHLFDVPLLKFEYLYENKKKHIIKGYRTKENIYGEEYTIVVGYNEKTHKKQKEQTSMAVEKIKKKFEELENALNNKKGGKKATTKSMARRINKFLYQQYQKLFFWDFNEKKQKIIWKLNQEALVKREKTFGKTVMFTDLEDWSTKQIAKTYNSKSIVEEDFKVLKDRLLISIKPVNHRLDHRIRAHIFVCVLSVTLYRYMLWKLKELKLTDKTIVRELRKMRLSFVKQEGSNSVRKVLETMTEEQIELYNKLGLKRFIPN